MAHARTPRGKWIEQGLIVLAEAGPEGVRVEHLAERLGVTKGGFYGYFRSREALLTEMLDAWERDGTEAVVDAVEAGGGDARTRLDRLMTLMASFGDGPTSGTTLDLAVRDWARRDRAVAERLQRVDNRRMDYLRSLFAGVCDDPAEVEVRCLITFSIRIGNHLIQADHPDRTREEVMRLTKERLLS